MSKAPGKAFSSNLLAIARVSASNPSLGLSEVVSAVSNLAPIPDKLADEIRSARVAARTAYTDGRITRVQYEAQNSLINELVLIQIRWYKSYIKYFDELSFIGASGDGGAVF